MTTRNDERGSIKYNGNRTGKSIVEHTTSKTKEEEMGKGRRNWGEI